MRLPEGALCIMERLEAAGFEAYAVGGCVRDALLGLTPQDYDLCTSATPEEMLNVFAGSRVLKTGLAHGTVTVFAQGATYEVTTYRVDGAYADHRRPDRVTFVRDIVEDLARRDFTVNAMAYHPRSGLVDPFGGQEDLAKGRIRCVGDPHTRFSEDALRILRALRFSAVYDFVLEEDTALAAHDLRATLERVAKERVTAEWCKLVCGRAAERILGQFADLLGQIMPGVSSPDGLDATPPSLPLRLAHLARRVDPMRALSCLRLDKDTRRAALELAEASALPQPQNAVQVRRLMRVMGKERVDQLYCLKGWPQEELDGVLRRGDCVCVRQLAVDGHDLMAAGVPAGSAVGAALERLLDKVVEGELPNERQALLRGLKESE